MCLSTKMSAKKKAEFKEQTEGWKVLAVIDGGLGGDCVGKKMIRPIGRWLGENGFNLGYTHLHFNRSGESYDCGWHIWLTLDGAKKWVGNSRTSVIKKAKFKKAVEYGWQRNYPVVVAKEMMILKEAA